MKPISIRPATADDVDFMWEMLYEAVHWPPEKGEPKPSREEVFAIPEMSHYLEGWGRRDDIAFVAVDEESGERLGAAWHRQATSGNPGYGFIDDETPELAVAVVPEARGRGIGGCLMEAIIEAARSSGYKALSLSVERTNPAARLYERRGFREIESRETDLLMKLDLKTWRTCESKRSKTMTTNSTGDLSGKKVVLAYSGGLDTSVCLKWLQEQGATPYAMYLDLGQGQPSGDVEEKALGIGAAGAFVRDAKEEFVSEYLAPAIRANALYGGKYPLFTALGRPLIAKKLVEAAREVGATHIAHGSTGKGNDQVRFDVTTASIAPDLHVVAPVRDWNMNRPEEIEYAKKHGLPFPSDITKESPYSIDANLFGRSIEAGPLEDPNHEPDSEVYKLTVEPEDAPDEPRYIEISFEEGWPAALDGEEMSLLDLLVALGEVAGAHGVGRIDMIEDRLVGIKSREIYEAPAAMTVIQAHQELESMTLAKDVLRFKAHAEQRYAELTYDGLWFTPLKSALDAFISETQRTVTGTVRLKLYKGSSTVVGRTADKALYNKDLATYDADSTFDEAAAAGFITLWGLPARQWASINGAVNPRRAD